jgi:transcriptional regulator with XRE-family HTH domain
MNRKQFGEFIKAQRMAQNMTQGELAEKANISRRQAIMEAEKDMCDYGINALVNILAALGFELLIRPLTRVSGGALDFSKIQSAEPQDDPNFEKPKKERKFAKQKSNKK